MFSARNSRAPAATRCRCGGHAGNIVVLGALHMVLSSLVAEIKVNISEHTSSARMTEMERPIGLTVSSCQVWQGSVYVFIRCGPPVGDSLCFFPQLLCRWNPDELKNVWQAWGAYLNNEKSIFTSINNYCTDNLDSSKKHASLSSDEQWQCRSDKQEAENPPTLLFFFIANMLSGNDKTALCGWTWSHFLLFAASFVYLPSKRSSFVPCYGSTDQIASVSRLIFIAETRDASVIQLPNKIKAITSCSECRHNNTILWIAFCKSVSLVLFLYWLSFKFFFFFWPELTFNPLVAHHLIVLILTWCSLQGFSLFF